MPRTMKVAPIVLICALIIAVPSVWANWIQGGVAICTATGEQWEPTITSDGAGGAIVTWYDFRSGTGHIYAQKVSASGDAQWTADGVAICVATGGQLYPKATSDGTGGAIITWRDYRSGNEDIYAQRVNASGAVQWMADGVAICAAAGAQMNPQIVSDGAGGAIVTWDDNRSGSSDVYAQRVNASGAVQWMVGGVALCTATGGQDYPTIVSDGAGGAIVTWEDYRSGNGDIYAQRVNASGAVQWTMDGVALCARTGIQAFPKITSDGTGGAIVSWEDARMGWEDIYAQRVNAAGAVQWTINGVALCTAQHHQAYVEIVSDDAGGAIVTWWDGRSEGDTPWDIYVQRVNASGAVQWTADGVALCTATGDQQPPEISADGAGGAIVAWWDGRSGDEGIYAQRVNGSGAAQWITNGVFVCATGSQWSAPTITSSGAGGAIVTWQDERSGNGDIYAQRLNGAGGITDADVPKASETGYLSQNYPNPFNPTTRITFWISVPEHVSLRIYDASGRLMQVLMDEERQTGRYEASWGGRDGEGKAVTSGIYFCRLDAGSFTQTRKMVLLK